MIQKEYFVSKDTASAANIFKKQKLYQDRKTTPFASLSGPNIFLSNAPYSSKIPQNLNQVRNNSQILKNVASLNQKRNR